MKITEKNFVAGVEVDGYGSARGEACDPKTGKRLPTDYPILNDMTVSAILAMFGPDNVEKRAELLDQIASEIENLGDELLQTASEETALPIARLTGERGRTCGQLRMFAKLLREGDCFKVVVDEADPNRQPPKPRLVKKFQPIGVVAVFGASNFPLAYSVAGGDTASALAAGCPVIVKAHPAHPKTSELVARAIYAALDKVGLRKGWFSMVHGGVELGQALVRHLHIAAVGFTGSQFAGRALFDIANQRPYPIPVFAEMGSVNPVFLMPTALKNRAEAIAKGYVASLTMGVGQFCTNPGVVYGVKGPELERFVVAVEQELKASVEGTMLTESIAKSYRESLNKIDRIKGVTTVVNLGSKEIRKASPMFARCDNETYHANLRLREEVFGPFGLLVEVDLVDLLPSEVLLIEGQLTATVHFDKTEDEDESEVTQHLISLLALKAGRVIMNGYPTGVEVSPAMVHGGPYPASTDSRFTAVGPSAIERWLRPVCYQDVPDDWI